MSIGCPLTWYFPDCTLIALLEGMHSIGGAGAGDDGGDTGGGRGTFTNKYMLTNTLSTGTPIVDAMLAAKCAEATASKVKLKPAW
jgi:hypothetical protein